MQHTAKSFAVQLGALIALYTSVTSLLVLLFSIITLVIPDPAAGSWENESAMSSIRFTIATLVVFFLTYIALTRIVNRQRRRDEVEYLNVTKWLLYLSLLVVALILLGNVVAVVYAFLDGELTARFLWKALVLAVVLGSAFYYYLLDVKGYWHTHERTSMYCAVTAITVVLAAAAYGIMLIQSPGEVRELRLDQRQIEDLTEMQWRIDDTLHREGVLHDDLQQYFTINQPPTAPGDRAAYSYARTDDGFELCATFALSSNENPNVSPHAMPRLMPGNDTGIRNPNDWEYAAGRHCFERTVQLPSSD